MSSTDRRYGLIGNTAIKVPCRACSATNITLSGEQTIDGVAVVTDDRVLVTAQTSSVNNGIYVADTGAWVRAPDMDGTYDIVTGTLVKVNSGTSNSGFWYVTTTGTPVIGTDAVDFGMASSALAVVSAFMQTVLDDATAALARATLDAQEDVLTTIGDGIRATTAGAAARIAATANVAAHATTMNLWAARENVLTGGAVTVTDIADAPYAGAVAWVKMNAAHVWDDGAVFNVQGGADYTAAADDWIRIYATTVSTFEVTVFRADPVATQADQETASSTTTSVSPGRQQFHPSAAKAWAIETYSGSYSNPAGYNITSVAVNSTGNLTVTIATDFSSANYSVVANANASGAVARGASPAAGTFVMLVSLDSDGTATDAGFSFACFGDQS